MKFEEVLPSDELLTMGADGQAYYDRPSKLHKSRRVGKILRREGRGSNFSVTPNHRMVYTSRKLPGLQQFEEAGSMSWDNKSIPRTVKWLGKRLPKFRIPQHVSARKVYPAREVPMDSFLKVLAWYLTEGSIQRQNGAPGTVSIAQRIEENRKEIAADLEGIGCTPKHTTNAVYAYDPALAAYLDMFGKGFAEKFVPDFVFDLPPDQIKLFLEVAVKGDGYDKDHARSILYTGSKRLADDYQRLILLCDNNSTVTKRGIKGQRKWIKDHWAVSSCDGYVVSWAKHGRGMSAQKAKPEEVDYDGMVYCATISGGVLLTRRNGVSMWSGNSEVPDTIYEVRAGGLTDGEPMAFDFGNPIHNTGRFYEQCEGKLRSRHIVRRIDSRDVSITNKELYKEWIEDYGVDSDYVKVRVRGMFPSMGSLQFIPTDWVERQATAKMVDNFMYPVLIGVDVARFGDDDSVIAVRVGRDARQWKYKTFSGADTHQLTGEVIHVIREMRERFRREPHIFVDGTGVGGGVVDNLRAAGYSVREVQLGSSPIDRDIYRYKSDECWGRLKEALRKGEIYLPDDERLKRELTQRFFGYTQTGKIHLETKKDMKARLGSASVSSSPDVAEAYALTFAEDVNELDDSMGSVNTAVPKYNPFEWRYAA